MRNNWFKAVLLSALMVTALLLPLIAVGSTTTAESTSGSAAPLYIDPENYHVILHGKGTMHQEYNFPATPMPEVFYSPGDNPPIMVGKKIESGAVVAFSGVATFRGGSGYYGTRGYPDNVRWKEGEFDVFMDKVFQWLKPGAEDILWYDGYSVYHTHTVAEFFIDNMVAAPYNYNITWTASEPITSSLLGDNDIFVIAQFELGAGATGGDPSLLPDADVAAIVSFVNGGGGLLIMDGGDYATYNFYKVQNKVLNALGFTDYLFQSDSLEDNVNFRQELGETEDTPYLPVVDVDNETWIGSAYENETGENEIGLYAICSLRSGIMWDVEVTTKPVYQAALPGASVTFDVRVKNKSDYNYDNFDLEVTDNLTWDLTLPDNVVNVENTTTETVTLTVKVPNDAPYRVQDNITITATSQGDDTKSAIFTTSIYVSTWIAPPTDDAGAVEGDDKENTPQGTKAYVYVGSGDNTTAFQNERGYFRFDLGDGLPSGYTIENARLYLYCFRTMGPLGNNIAVYGLDNDDWSEVDLTWNNQPAGASMLLDTENVTENYEWYSWDVAPFLENYPTDNIVSFLVRAETENETSPDNYSYGFDTLEYDSRSLHPYLVFGVRPVASYITENMGPPGENVTVEAVINNRGAVVDNYDVSIASQSGWTVSPTATVLNNVQQGENRTVEITVTIPDNENLIDTWENLIVTATSQTDSDYESSINKASVHVVYPFDLGSGWTLAGFHHVSENPDTPGRMFENIEHYVWYLKPPMYGWGLLGDGEPFEIGVGYWVWLGSAVTTWTTGPPVDNHTLDLRKNWNLVSVPVTSNNTTPGNLLSGFEHYVWYLDVMWKLLGDSDPFELAVGYWVWIENATTVTVPYIP